MKELPQLVMAVFFFTMAQRPLVSQGLLITEDA